MSNSLATEMNLYIQCFPGLSWLLHVQAGINYGTLARHESPYTRTTQQPNYLVITNNLGMPQGENTGTN